MQFERVSMYCTESREGYLIAAVKVSGKWGYDVSGPKRKRVRRGRYVVAVIDPIKGRIPYRTQYDISDEVPADRESLGFFHEDKHGGTEAARQEAEAACIRHFEQVQHLQTEQSRKS